MFKFSEDHGRQPIKLVHVGFEFGSSHFLKARLSTQLSRIAVFFSTITLLAANQRLDFRRLQALAFLILCDDVFNLIRLCFRELDECCRRDGLLFKPLAVTGKAVVNRDKIPGRTDGIAAVIFQPASEAFFRLN